MASLAFDFDDQLSEDWISQPRSSDGDASPKKEAFRSSIAQSRIPVPTRPVASGKPTPAASDFSSRPSPRPLHSKSKSELNIPIIPHGKGRAVSPVPKGTPRSTSVHKRSSSAQSWTGDGTVHHFGSEVRHPGSGTQMTPEWKRRLLKGQAQDGQEGKDLFSPLGLENVFRAPQGQKANVKPASPKRNRLARTRAESSTIYPSSPPPYPSTSRRRATTKSTSPSPLREHPPHDLCTGQGGKCEGATRTPTPTQRKVRMKSYDEESAKGRRGSVPLRTGSAAGSSSGVADHESISPVTISRGRIDYRTIQASVLQLRDKMEELGIPDQKRPSSRSSDHGVNYGSEASIQGPKQLTGKPDSSWLGWLGPRSDAALRRNDFVGTRRGGYSSDDNFHNRALSPCSFKPEQSLLDLKSEVATLDIRRTRSPGNDARLSKSSPEKPKSGGSPLKLFGKHDTFTNDHLMRRLSQYADAARARNDRASSPPSPSPRRSPASKRKPEELQRSTKFGEGKMSSYNFLGDESLLVGRLLERSGEDSGEEDEPSLPPVLPPKDPVKFRIPSGPGLDPARRVSRAMSRRLPNPYSSQRLPRRPSLAEFRKSVDSSDLRSDGKRMMASPGKSHEAKRRKTLLSSVGSPDASLDIGAPPLIVGKKRKDVLPTEKAGYANAETLASRAMIRPRSVSPQVNNSPTGSMSSWLGVASSRQVSRQQQTEMGLDQSTKILAEDLASFALNVAQGITDGKRKASVTTADFFKEANMIMQHLRGQIAPTTASASTHSGRISGETSIAEPLPEIAEQDEPSSREQSGRFSVADVLKNTAATKAQEQLANKLNRYKERDDPMFAMSKSVQNLQIAPEHIPNNGNLPASDANIRIREQAAEEAPIDTNDDEQIRTRSTTGHSTSRSIRTGSSSNNSRKFNIAPDTVKDLLSDHVGRMIFDHGKGVWVRNRTSSSEKRPESAQLSSDLTEEDPLKSIPDLEDNNFGEMRHPGSGSASSGASSDGTVITRSKDGASMRQNSGHITSVGAQETNQSRPSSGHGADSSQLSKASKFGSSQTAPETRATSWSTVPSTKIHGAAAEPELTQVQETRESSTDGGNPTDQGAQGPAGVSKSKTATISFSSPLSIVPDEVLFEKARANEPTNPQKSNLVSVDAIQPPSSAEQTPIRRNRIASALARNKDRAKRHLSVVKQRYSDRPVSRIDETDEFGNSPARSLALATPYRSSERESKALSVPPPSSARHSSVAFHRSLHLDPLSEFTIHQADESLNLDVNYVMQRHKLSTDAEVDSQFSLAVRDLVARVTDIEPFEPYWEYISRLELPRRKMMTLHMLEEFCPRIEELDVDENELGQLNGVPETLKTLSARNNCLTSVTSWGHLRNLHYLQADNNQIKNLKGFESLVHLRELSLNGNEIENLDGIENLQSLIKLKLRGNKIGKVALSDISLSHLVELDLGDNGISEVSGLDCIPALQRLWLHGNCLKSIDLSNASGSLTHVDLSKNQLGHLDVSQLSELMFLDVDSNCLSSISGLHELRRLLTLSWRAQNVSTLAGLRWTDASEVHELALSGNKLDVNQLGSTHFLNLKCLDLSCCGIESLPNKFGRMLPNLRFLNLNYNGLRDIRPLAGVVGLQELHLVGNRISRLRNTTTVLERVGQKLEVLDLRTNGITLGFYAGHGGLSPGSLKISEGQLMRRRSTIESALSLGAEKLSWDRAAMNTMSEANQALDQAHLDRLDESTAMRRRVYEVLVLHNCPHITVLDGLQVRQESICRDKDRIWQRLVELKVVKMKVAGTLA